MLSALESQNTSYKKQYYKTLIFSSISLSLC